MDREEILLKEYEICQSHNNAIASQVWLSTSIFMSINLTLFGGLLYALLQSKILIHGTIGNQNLTFVMSLALLLAVAVVLILCSWRAWLQRTQHITRVNNIRMRQIEDAIQVDGTSVMQKNWLVRGLDLTYRNEKDREKIPQRITDEIDKKLTVDKKLKRVGQPGFDSLNLIVCAAIWLWLSMIVLTVAYAIASLYFNQQVILIWILFFIIIASLAVWLIKRFCIKKEPALDR